MYIYLFVKIFLTIIVFIVLRHFLLKCLYEARKVSWYLYDDGINIVPLFSILIFDFGNVPTV
jgi:hypothetical protein